MSDKEIGPQEWGGDYITLNISDKEIVLLHVEWGWSYITLLKITNYFHFLTVSRIYKYMYMSRISKHSVNSEMGV
jgi:hypothetical protein